MNVAETPMNQNLLKQDVPIEGFTYSNDGPLMKSDLEDRPLLK